MKGWAPIGVVGAIVPWNFPLMLLSWKASVVITSLACGCVQVDVWVWHSSVRVWPSRCVGVA